MRVSRDKSFKSMLLMAVMAGGICLTANVTASVASNDIEAFQNFYTKKFPNIEFADFANGAYVFDEASREQWVEMEDFPPYEIAIEDGETLFNTPFANGKSYASCFENDGEGVRQNFPYYDTEQKQVVTLELAINQCREKNSEKPLPYLTGKLAEISAYMAYTSRDNEFKTDVSDDPGDIAAYEDGKQFYYARRGQLNFSCSSCHMQGVSTSLRAETISTSLGHVTHWPVYRSKWGEIGTLQKRFQECNSQVRAKVFEPQSESYRNLEYFLTVMSQGLNANGPGSRP